MTTYCDKCLHSARVIKVSTCRMYDTQAPLAVFVRGLLSCRHGASFVTSVNQWRERSAERAYE